MDDELQQLEALKKWWAENGKTVIAGVVLGLGAMGGWNWWQAHKQAQAEAASARLSEAMAQVLSVDGSNAAAGIEAAQSLVAEGSGTYAALGALLAARGALQADDTDAAIAHLREAITGAETVAMRSLAQLRLARMLVANGDLDGANANLDAIESDAFKSLGNELRGDIARARDDADSARQQYEAALADDGLPVDSQARLRLKLDALGSFATPPG